MGIPFKNVPTNLRVPLFYAELDNSQANSASAVQRTLLIAQKITAGIAPVNVPLISAGVGDAAVQGGQGSQLHVMTDAYRQNDSAGELWYLPLADDGGATAAVGSINFTAAATQNGLLSLYIGGIKVQMVVQTTMTAAQIATALVALVNATPLTAVTAAVDGAVTTKVNFTAKNAGLVGNDIDIRLNYGGAQAGEATPVGLAATIVAMAGGLLNPTLTTALANLASAPFDFIICPYNDATSLAALTAMMNDTTGRWAWSQQIYGHVFTALRGTFGALTTAGASGNDQHRSVLGFNDSPSPSMLWAAAYAGAAAAQLRIDPGRPLQTTQIFGVLPPPTQSRFTLVQRNQLLYTGISTFTVGNDGSVAIENLITSYLTNPYGQPDDSYLEVETLFLLMFVIRFLANRVTTKFARMKLAEDGTRFQAGSSIVTPSIIRGDQIAAFQELEFQGYVQDSVGFAANLIVQINAQNGNRVDVLWPGKLIAQLRIFALLAQFRKA